MTFADATTAAIDRAAFAYQHQGGLSGLSTGFRDLDK
jgi:replicative DNA helicase